MDEQELKITTEFYSLRLCPTEYEVMHFPSLKATIELTIMHPTGEIKYKASDIWFDFDTLEIFNQSIEKIRRGDKSISAILTDLSNLFTLSLSITKDQLRIKHNLTIKEIQPENDPTEIKAGFEDSFDTINIIWKELNDLLRAYSLKRGNNKF